MSDLPNGFNHFLLDKEQAVAMRAEFLPILTGTEVAKSTRAEEVISGYKGIPGIYFWVMRYQSAEDLHREDQVPFVTPFMRERLRVI